MQPIKHARLAGGYTLVEVLVAFAILALALTLLLGGMRRAAEQIRHAEAASRAGLYAQQILEQYTSLQALEIGQQQGEFENGAIRWVLDIQPYQETDPAVRLRQQQSAQALRLLHLDLHLQWGAHSREQLRLQSVRLQRISNQAGQ